MRLPLHRQGTTAETTTTLATSRRGSFADPHHENGNSRRQYGNQHFNNYRQRLPYTARFQKLDSQPDCPSWPETSTAAPPANSDDETVKLRQRVRINTWLWAQSELNLCIKLAVRQLFYIYSLEWNWLCEGITMLLWIFRFVLIDRSLIYIYNAIYWYVWILLYTELFRAYMIIMYIIHLSQRYFYYIRCTGINVVYIYMI